VTPLPFWHALRIPENHILGCPAGRGAKFAAIFLKRNQRSLVKGRHERGFVIQTPAPNSQPNKDKSK